MRSGAIVKAGIRFVLGRGQGRGSRLRSAILGIGLSFIPLVVVLEVADGMIQGITSRFLETGTYHIQGIRFETPSPDRIREATEAVEGIEEVTGAFPERRGMGLLYSEAGRRGVTIRAVEPSLWESDADFRRYMSVEAGRFELSNEEDIVLGHQMADALEVGMGDTVRLLTVRSLGEERFLPRVSTFRVRGIVSTGYSELDRLWVFIPLSRGLRIIPPDTGRFLIGVKVRRPYALSNGLFATSSDAYTADVYRALRSSLDNSYRFFTWYSLERSRYLSFQSTKNILVFIMGLIVAVAAINISSALVMLSIDKQPEIAILKAVGASSRDIASIFLVSGFLSGVIGTVVGMSAGLLFAVNINEVLRGVEFVTNAALALAERIVDPIHPVTLGAVDVFSAQFYLERIPIVLSFGELAVVAIGAIALATVSSVMPARRAGATRPIDIIRRH